MDTCTYAHTCTRKHICTRGHTCTGGHSNKHARTCAPMHNMHPRAHRTHTHPNMFTSAHTQAHTGSRVLCAPSRMAEQIPCAMPGRVGTHRAASPPTWAPPNPAPPPGMSCGEEAPGRCQCPYPAPLQTLKTDLETKTRDIEQGRKEREAGRLRGKAKRHRDTETQRRRGGGEVNAEVRRDAEGSAHDEKDGARTGSRGDTEKREMDRGRSLQGRSEGHSCGLRTLLKGFPGR